MFTRLICISLMLLLTSCSFFSVRKPIIEQGNIITEENVARLHPGLTMNEVVDIMGSPQLTNIFTPNRMEYVYTYQDRSNPRTEKRVACLFSNGRLTTINRYY